MSTTWRSDVAACRALLRTGSRTFYAASFLLPRPVRDPACALYAFCRLADDAVDEGPDGPVIETLREHVRLAYEGRPSPTPVHRAFADLVARFEIPRALPEALLEGFEWDLEGRRYEDLPSLRDYAVRVAGSVGAMMALIMGMRKPAVVARACDLGIAMQLTNIARDVGEDARAGRLYLPQRWLRDAGIDPESWLESPTFDPALSNVTERLLAAADELYAGIEAGTAQLPRACRIGIRASHVLYAEIGHEVRRRRCDSVTQRAVVSGPRKVRLLARSLLPMTCASVRSMDAVTEEAQFLIAAVAASPTPDMRPSAHPSVARGMRYGGPSPGRRLVWVVQLFERLEREERRQALASVRQRGESSAWAAYHNST